MNATYSYNKQLIDALEKNRNIVINTLHLPENHRFVYIGD